MSIPSPPPVLGLAPARKRVFARKGTIPEWVEIPIPGKRLRINTGEDAPVRTVSLNSKPMFTIGSDRECDVILNEMDRCLVTVYHHRSGSVYISAIGGSVDLVMNEVESEAVLNEPKEVVDGSLIRISAVANPIVLSFENRCGPSIKELLRSSQTDDDTTRSNTLRNSRQRKREVLSPIDPGTSNKCTPLSHNREIRKPRQVDGGSSGIERSVRFLDFN
jgi:hypothetical protein